MNKIATMFAVVVWLPSCTAIKSYATEAAKEAAAQVAVATIEKHLDPEDLAKFREADADQSGSISWEELRTWLGGGGALGFAWYMIQRRMRRKLGKVWDELETVKNGKAPANT